MVRTLPPLPIDEALPALCAALANGVTAVLAAPPGAGKTTRVPLALMAEPWAAAGRIVMLEPRRLAARAAAERMAAELGEAPGATVGYRIRGEAKVSAATRIEVVTEGILTRRLQSDPELSGIAAVIFDEIHERSIHSDLGLALALEAQAALRPDLRLLAMSATLETGRLAALMGNAPVIESAGRMFPVETRWLDTPGPGPGARARELAAAVAELVAHALAEAEGDALVFLPGAGEIERVAGLLAPRLPEVAVRRLHGSLPFAEQARALSTEPDGRRRIVLSTAIAETSLTVAGVRIVVDAGRARRTRVNPATGMSRLVTVPVSRAEAAQRRGRAGRTAPGVCYRLWTRAAEGALPEFAVPEILEADLAPLALELAAWGAAAGDLAFLDPPPEGALAEARALLGRLGALDPAGGLTPHGKAMAALPMHPRLAHMLIRARDDGLGAEAALLAALVSDRDPWRGPQGADLAPRLQALACGGDAGGRLDRAGAERIRAEARRLERGRACPEAAGLAAGPLAALAWPDRIGLRRPGDAPRWLLSGGRGAEMAAEDALAGQRLLVAVDLEDRGREATIRQAAAIAESDLRATLGRDIAWVETAEWSRRTGRVEARRREMLGAIALRDEVWSAAPAEALGTALAEGIRDRGLDALPWSPGALRLRARVAWLRAHGWEDRLPDWSDAGLLARLDDWLTPHLAGMRRIEATAGLDLAALLRGSLDHETAQAVDRAAPASFETPLGTRAAIDWDRAEPTLSLRVQELFGVTRHPCIGEPPVPLVLELLSPAGRPVQVTRDLPGFWSGTWAEVAKEMRPRYPRHPWPDDPAGATPTRRVKPRG